MKKLPGGIVGVDGNAFSIMGRFSSDAKKAGWDKKEIDTVLKDAMSGDYEHLVGVIAKQYKSPLSNVKGFTVVEALIVASIVGILAAIIIPNAVSYYKTGKFAIGTSEKCIKGYTFIVNPSGSNYVQLLDSEGHGVRCE